VLGLWIVGAGKISAVGDRGKRSSPTVCSIGLIAVSFQGVEAQL